MTPGAPGGLQYVTSTPYLGHNGEQFSPATTPYTPYQDYQEPTRDYDDLNKSDSEKVLAKKMSSVNFRTDDLDILYNARGKEIDKLQKQLAEEKAENEKELRSCRHQLALARSENHNNVGGLDQLTKVVSDARRENKVLTGEIHNMNLEVKRLNDENEALVMEKESSGNIIQQLQIQLSQLQSNDAVLKARTQHDATVRSLLERHKEEMMNTRAELDRANTRLVIVEQENSNISHRLSSALQEKEDAVRAKVEAVTELSAKLTESLRSNSSEEVNRLRLEVRMEREERERERAETRRLEREVDTLKVEIGAMEALGGGQDDSAAQLGLGGAEAEVSANLRVRTELHRSLVSNRTKREEISRLEATLRSKDRELERVQNKETEHLRNIEGLKSDLHSASINATQNSYRVSSKEEELREELRNLEDQNMQLKKHISEIVEGNDADRQEAIDELREEYELHVQEAVQETKLLMDQEIKKLKIEIEVYDKTLVELRNKLTEAEGKNEKYSNEIDEFRCKAYDNRKDDEKLNEEIEAKLKFEIEKDFNLKLENSKAELRDIWKVESKLQADEAVASARLEWIKNLPDIQKNGGVRESIGELERIKELLGREKDFKMKLENKLYEKESEISHLIETQKYLQRKVEESKRDGMKEVEDSLGQELKESLRKQQDQWENIVKNTRDEAELSRNQLVQHWESQVDHLEQKLRHKEKERFELKSKDRQNNAILEQMKKTLNEKELMIERIKKGGNVSEDSSRKGRELRLLQEELKRRNSEVERQRGEMTSLASRWQSEMEEIQSTHKQEKAELEECRSKYRLLKSKVRKYHDHMEAKEAHYKSEYSRLEAEFRGTLEKLQERMEAAYRGKERMVSEELGTMRQELSREMRDIISHNHGDLNEKPVKLVN